jgi:outer membrane protein assembly factor BamA
VRVWKALALSAALALCGPPGAATAAAPQAAPAVREIRLVGNDHTRDFVLLREIASAVGAPYDPATAAADVDRLYELGLFSVITTSVEDVEGGVALVFTVIENLLYMPSLAASISDENGLSLGAGLTAYNLRGVGIRASGRAMFGGVRSYEAQLTNPWFAGDHMSYTVKFFHRERDNMVDLFREESDELDLVVSGHLSGTGRWGARFTYIDLRSDVDGKTLSADNRDQAVSLGAFLAHDTRDRDLDTRSGWYNEIALTQTGGVLGGDGDHLRLDLDARRYTSLPSDLSLGAFVLTSLTTGEVGRDLAVWQDFALGGVNTVNGWALNSRSGRNQMIGSLELRYTLLEPRGFRLPLGVNYRGGLQVALYGDAGVAWNDGAGFALGRSIAGGGVSLRFLLPVIRQARIDFAMGEGGAGLQVGFASLEKPAARRERLR